jgi:hypothetical protein
MWKSITFTDFYLELSLAFVEIRFERILLFFDVWSVLYPTSFLIFADIFSTNKCADMVIKGILHHPFLSVYISICWWFVITYNIDLMLEYLLRHLGTFRETFLYVYMDSSVPVVYYIYRLLFILLFCY